MLFELTLVSLRRGTQKHWFYLIIGKSHKTIFNVANVPFLPLILCNCLIAPFAMWPWDNGHPTMSTRTGQVTVGHTGNYAETHQGPLRARWPWRTNRNVASSLSTDTDWGGLFVLPVNTQALFPERLRTWDPQWRQGHWTLGGMAAWTASRASQSPHTEPRARHRFPGTGQDRWHRDP